MNLPNYFLADLPRDAELTGPMIREACQTLKRNREQYLQDRSTPSLARALCELAASWLDPEFRFRKLALAAPPEQTGFAPATLASGLDAFFREITPDQVQALLEQDLGHRQRLDGMCAAEPEEKRQRAALARGPELIVHITAGNLPVPALSSMVVGLLLKSAQLVKCASGGILIPRLFAHSLYELEPKLGACLEIVEWPGGRGDLETAAYSESDCVTATGSDETLGSIRQQLPLRVRFVGYGHRVSFGYVTKEMLSGFNPARLVTAAAADVTAWNQLGCLSPHLIYTERGGRVSPEQFAEMLAAELARLEKKEPRGPVPAETAAAIATRRAFYEVRAAHSEETRMWSSANATAWTVVFETDPRFQASCLHRFIYVKSVANVKEALQAADSARRFTSTVGLAATEDRAQELATLLARWGATRICPLGRMQNPPLNWRHDGHPALGELVTWSDWET